MTNVAIENGNLQFIYPLKIVFFHSYVNLPEGRMWVWLNMGNAQNW